MALTLGSAGATATIDASDGGRLTSLLIDGVETIGGARPAPGAPEGWYHGVFPMAPYAGRVRNAEFTFEGRPVRLPPNNGPHAGHGLVFDRPWTVVRHSTSRLSLRIELDDRWPWGGTVEQAFALEPGQLEISLTIRNEQRRMPAALGLHPWFARRTQAGSASFTFLPARRFSTDAEGFPGPAGTDLGRRPWDDVFSDLMADPVVSWPDGPRMRLSSNADIWTVFEQLDEGFCIEPLTAPPNSIGAMSAAVVGPGQPLGLRFCLTWAEPWTEPRSH